MEGQLFASDSSCSPSPGQSGLVVYSYEPPVSGVASLYLSSAAYDGSLSVRTECGSRQSEQACRELEPVSGVVELEVDVTQSETIFVVVESSDRDVPFVFDLVSSSREMACGDGYVDGDEACDDGNFDDADGCSNACEFQPTEVEPNDGIADANEFVAPASYGSLLSESDRDVVPVQVPQGYDLVAQSFDLGDGACARLEMDSYLELFDSEGELVAADDDSGVGFCAALVAPGLDAGEYFVRITPTGQATTFQYRLEVGLSPP